MLYRALYCPKTWAENFGANLKTWQLLNAGDNINKAICLDCKLGDDYRLLFLISDIISTTNKKVKIWRS